MVMFGLRRVNLMGKAKKVTKNATEKNDDHKVTDKAGEVAKSIWLAGLGAYGKAFDEAHDRYEKVSKETSRMFDELVSKGKKLEGETQDKLSDVKEKSSLSIEERIHKVRSSLGFNEKGNNSVAELHEKVDELSKKLDLLIAAAGSQSRQKKTGRAHSLKEAASADSSTD
jgi:hypothetical protein